MSDWKHEHCARRPGAKQALCVICHKPFVSDEQRGWKATKVMVRETRTSWFRGDDVVEFAHPECVEAKKARGE